MKNSTLIAVILILISCKVNHKPEIATLYDNHLEVLNGKVKQIIEITSPQYPGFTDTAIVDFDVRGNITQIISERGGDSMIKCEYLYDKNGKKSELLQRYYEKWERYKNCRKEQVFKYDGNGRIMELISDTKMLKSNSDHEVMQDKFFYRYDVVGNFIQMDHYLETEHLQTCRYKYNHRHLLAEMDGVSIGANSMYKTTYTYQSFDKNGNWLKREKTHGDELAKSDTITRKITYY